MSDKLDYRQYDVVVVGSIYFDLMCYSKRLPIVGQTVPGTDFYTACGGKGANQCVAAQKLGAVTAFVGKVGDDENGLTCYKHLKSEGIDVDNVLIERGTATGIASVMVGTENGQNLIICVPGANAHVNSMFVHTHGESLIQSSKVVVCQMEIPTDGTFEALKLAKKYSATSILNVAPAVTQLPKEILEKADILCVNQSEAEVLSGVSSIKTNDEARQAIQKLVKEFGCKNIIITMGSEGAVLWDQEYYSHAHTHFTGNVIDTTGAGDCFIGVLAYCLADGYSLDLAMRRATVNASESVKMKGTQNSFPSKLV